MTEVQESFSQHVFSFEPFTQHAFYTTINQALIQQALAHRQAIPPATPLTVVDLACGTGAITELVAQALAQRGQSARFIALDSAAEALECARGRLSGLPVTFLQSNVSDLDELDHQIDHADLVFFCNAIHLVSGKEALFTRLARILRPGGVLACNSTFFDGAYVPGTEGCYRLSIRRALEFLRRDYPGVRPARQAGTPAMEWLTAADYKHLFESTGFSTLRCPLQQGDLPLQAWQDIGSYSGFIAGALPGIPLHLGALALRDAAERVFSEMGLTVIPRYWLQMTAVAE